MELSEAERADRRYSLQACWSRDLRRYLFRNYFYQEQVSVLEVGSGTGAVLRSLRQEFGDRIGVSVGVEKDPGTAFFAGGRKCGSTCIGLGEDLPFAGGSFDLVFCHYLLLWVSDPFRILREMKRVTAPGGICAAMAEPCYAEMYAQPEDLEYLARLQRDELAARGADLMSGKRLGDLFRRAGFSKIEYGRYGLLPDDSGFLDTEIAQMLKDTGSGSFRRDPRKVYHYDVPTYYAIAKKEADE